MSRRKPYALVYRVRDPVTGRKRRARWLLDSLDVAETLVRLMATWPEFSDAEVVSRGEFIPVHSPPHGPCWFDGCGK